MAFYFLMERICLYFSITYYIIHVYVRVCNDQSQRTHIKVFLINFIANRLYYATRYKKVHVL